MANEKAQPGNPYPLGSHYDGKGVNFALFSANATRVELCLFFIRTASIWVHLLKAVQGL